MHKQENTMHDQEKQLIRSSAAIIRTPTGQQTDEESDFQKRLASPILRHSHFAHSKRVGRSPLISKAAGTIKFTLEPGRKNLLRLRE
jgi:hypothetical protein